MEIEQHFMVPFALEQVWRCFRNTESLVGCLPGAALTAPPEDGKLALSMTVKLGPIVANFAGQGEMTLDEAAHRGSISGSGNDRKSGSRIKGQATFVLTPADAATRVDIRVDYTVAGSLAQFSRGGIVRELAERLTSAFSENLRAILAATEAAPAAPAEPAVPAIPAVPATSAAPAIAPPPAAVVPLDLGKLFWPALLARLKRWLGLSGA